MKTSPSPHSLAGLPVPWLAMGQSHGHEGEDVQLHVQWWPHSPAAGPAPGENLSAWVVDPLGGRGGIALAGCPADCSLRFKPPMGGLYQVIVRNDDRYVLDRQGKHRRGTRLEYPEAARAICFTQYAQCIVAVGHHPAGGPKPSGLFLEIRAADWRHWRPGDVLSLTVLHRGETLDGIAVDVVMRGPAGHREWRETTGPDGEMALRATGPGRYLVIARHQTPGYGEDACDEVWLTTTFAFLVTK